MLPECDFQTSYLFSCPLKTYSDFFQFDKNKNIDVSWGIKIITVILTKIKIN